MFGQIALHDVTLGYERHPAVHHVSGAFASGSLTAVVGPNGGGKSTLLKGMMGLLRPLGGTVTLTGFRHRDLAYLPQQAEVDMDFPISVLDTVTFGHWHRLGPFRAMTAGHRQAALAALAAVGLTGFERRAIGSLSVGQRQRALFARVMVADSPVILLDEPFAGVDSRTTVDLLDLVLRWHGEGRTVIAVLHDFDQVRQYFPQTLLLARELIDWGPTEEVLVAPKLLRARAMSEAWEGQADICQRGAA